MPTASAMSAIDVAANPRVQNIWAAWTKICSRRATKPVLSCVSSPQASGIIAPLFRSGIFKPPRRWLLYTLDNLSHPGYLPVGKPNRAGGQ